MFLDENFSPGQFSHFLDNIKSLMKVKTSMFLKKLTIMLEKN